jgi:AAA+ ATPase superfamily predicted ATPase
MVKSSPFSPGSPVPVEFFVGRTREINDLMKHIKQIRFGKQENIFLSGERGIGKSSFARYMCSLAEMENFLSIHVFLGDVTNLDEVVSRTLDQILKASQSQAWYDKIVDYFNDKVQQRIPIYLPEN